MILFASDFDDTLYFHQEGGLRPEDIEAIARFQKAGNRFGLCTGRSCVMMGSVNEKLKGKVRLDFTIFSNGACLVDEQGKVVEQTPLPVDLLKHLLEKYPKVPMVFHHPDSLYWNVPMENVDAQVKMLDADASQILDGNVVEISLDLHAEGTREVLEEIEKISGVHAVANSLFVDVISDEASKGRGLLRLAQKEGIGVENTAAIGDSFNDISMIQNAAAGFTFLSSAREVRESADFLVSGIAQAVDILLKRQNARSEKEDAC